MRGARNQTLTCTNCGGVGHLFRQCIAPVMSYGVIMARARQGRDFSITKTLSTTYDYVTGLEAQPLEFLLIQRRDSLGFIELMRGRYRVNDVEYMILHMKRITAVEREKYKTGPFEELWNGMWGLDHSHLYRNEYETAKSKWETIHRGVTDSQGKAWTVDDMIAESGEPEATPEWGFPKGRRDQQENDYTCAMREMFEETGVKVSDVIVIQNLEPLTERFFGSNHVHYCHKYYIVWVPPSVNIDFDEKNDHMRREIGDIRWFSAEEGLAVLRPENIEKKEVLLRAASLFRNLCPLPLGQ